MVVAVRNLLLLFLGLQLLSSPLTLTTVNGEEVHHAECKQVLTSIISRQMVSLKSCMEEMKFKDGKEKVAKMMCVMKCSLMKEGFLGKDGNVDLIGSMNFLDALPTDVKEKALELFMGCHKHIGKVDPNEESCKSYEPLLKCCQQVINKLCVLDNSSTVPPTEE